MKMISIKYFLISLTIHSMLGGVFIFANQSKTKPETDIIVTELLIVSSPAEKKNKIRKTFEKKKNQKNSFQKSNQNSKKLIQQKSKQIEQKIINEVLTKAAVNQSALVSQKANKISTKNQDQFKINKLHSNKKVNTKKDQQNQNFFDESPVFKNTFSKQISKAVYKIGSIKNPHPPYPLIARKKGMEGKLILNVKVNKDGLVDNVVVKESSGHKILDNVSKKTVQKWEFIPAEKYGDAIEDTVFVPIRFVLTE